MATKLFLIVTKTKVYASYVQTICFERPYTNEDSLEAVKKEARAALCSYAFSFGSVLMQSVDLSYKYNGTSEEVFEFLEQQHTTEKEAVHP